MEEAKFQAEAQRGLNMLRAAFSGMAPGDVIAYNAYWGGTEVIVAGYTYEQDGHEYTKPLAVLMTPEIFNNLLVDGESGRFGAEPGVVQDPKVQ